MSVSAPEDRLVYHYCSTDAFMSIIKSNRLRLTSSLASNDAFDGILLNEAMRRSLDKNSKLSDCEKKKILNTFTQRSFEWIPFVACFSYAKDLLSQWRGYADGGRGIALGFSESSILAWIERMQKQCSHGEDYFLEARKIDYKQSNDDFEEIIDAKLQRIESEPKAGVFTAEKTKINDCNYNLLFELKRKSIFLKKEEFQEEQEFRICFFSNRYSFSDVDLTNAVISRVDFLNRNNVIVPYFDFHLPELRCVLIGPKNPSPIEQIFYFVNSMNSLNDRSKFPSDCIEKSCLSLR